MNTNGLVLGPVYLKVQADGTTIAIPVTGLNFIDDPTIISNPDGSVDIRTPRNYSYNLIEASQVLKIPTNQQMISYQDLEVLDTGELEINGEFILVD